MRTSNTQPGNLSESNDPVWERYYHGHAALGPATRPHTGNRMSHLCGTEQAAPLRRGSQRPVRFLQQDHSAPAEGAAQLSMLRSCPFRARGQEPADIPSGKNGLHHPLPKLTQLPPISPRTQRATAQDTPQPRSGAEAGANPTPEKAPLEGRASRTPAQGARAREEGRQVQATQGLPKGTHGRAHSARRPSSAAIPSSTRRTSNADPPSKAACKSRGKGCTQADAPAAATSVRSLPYTRSTSAGSRYTCRAASHLPPR